MRYSPFVYPLSFLVILAVLFSAYTDAPVAQAQQPPSISTTAPDTAGESASSIDNPAQPAEPEVTIEELVQRARANHPQFQIARQSLEAARQRLEAARALRNPVLQVVPGFTGNSQARDEEIILSQPLDLFGRRSARAALADAEVHRVEAQSTLSERSLIVSVKNAAADLFAAQEAESLGKVQVEVAQLFRDAAARRAQLGDVPPVQVQRAELELLRAQNDLTAAQTERLTRRATLNQLIGEAPEMPLRVALPLSTDLIEALRVNSNLLQTAPSNAPANSVPSNTPATPPVDIVPPSTGGTPMTPRAPLLGGSSQVGSDLLSLRSQLLPRALQRSDIAVAEATLEARRAQIEVLRSERRPNIEIQARHSSVTGSGSTALRAVVVVPIFDFGSNRGERRALEAEVSAQEAQIALLRSQAAAQVEQALLGLQQRRKTVENYRTGIVPSSVALLKKTQIGYGLGASTYLEVLDAQRTLRQVQTEYLQALVGVRTSEAQLESALGATVPAGLTGLTSTPNPASITGGVITPATPQLVNPSNPPVTNKSPAISNNPAIQGGR